MKKIIAKIVVCISIIFCMMPDALNAQNKKSILMPGYDNQPYHFGFIVGYNQMLLSGIFLQIVLKVIFLIAKKLNGFRLATTT